MNTNYRFYLTAISPNGSEQRSSYEVYAFIASEYKWSPYDLCTDSMTAAIADGVTSLGAQRIDAEREKLAAEISRRLTEHIMRAIKTHDTVNGYAKT